MDFKNFILTISMLVAIFLMAIYYAEKPQPAQYVQFVEENKETSLLEAPFEIIEETTNTTTSTTIEEIFVNSTLTSTNTTVYLNTENKDSSFEEIINESDSTSVDQEVQINQFETKNEEKSIENNNLILQEENQNVAFLHDNNSDFYENDSTKSKNTNNYAVSHILEQETNYDQIESSLLSESPKTSTMGELEFVKNFSRGTFYTYGTSAIGGSGRALIDCSIGSGSIKGSIASSYLYNLYGYGDEINRPIFYLQCLECPKMNGYYYLDDSDAGNPEVIDFFYLYADNCPFNTIGVVSVDCYHVK